MRTGLWWRNGVRHISAFGIQHRVCGKHRHQPFDKTSTTRPAAAAWYISLDLDHISGWQGGEVLNARSAPRRRWNNIAERHVWPHLLTSQSPITERAYCRHWDVDHDNGKQNESARTVQVIAFTQPFAGGLINLVENYAVKHDRDL